MIKTLSWRVELSFGLLIIALCLLGIAGPVLAEETTTADQSEVLEDMGVETSDKPISSFKVFWHNVRDNVSLSLTFDSVKKAEKELKYAEKRIRWANTLAESDNENAQERALKLSARADEYMIKIEEKKEKLLEKADERTNQLLENITKHQSNKMKVWDKLETKIPVEKLEDFSIIRENVEGHEKQFLENLLKNDKVSEEVREKLTEKKMEFEVRINSRQEFIKENKGFLERVKEENSSISDEERKIMEEKREEMKAIYHEKVRENFEDYKFRNGDGESFDIDKASLEGKRLTPSSLEGRSLILPHTGNAPSVDIETTTGAQAEGRVMFNNSEDGIEKKDFNDRDEVEKNIPSIRASNDIRKNDINKSDSGEHYKEVKTEYKKFLKELQENTKNN